MVLNYHLYIIKSADCQKINLKNWWNLGFLRGQYLVPCCLCYIRGFNSFLIMCDNINNKLCLYADNANLVINKSSIENFSILNFSKTNIIQFHTNHSRNVSSPLIMMADKVIQEVESTTFLGLTIDQLPYSTTFSFIVFP